MASEVSSEVIVLFIEPFYGGSHKQLIDTLINGVNKVANTSTLLLSLPAKKWHWRARTSALYLSQIIPQRHNFKVLFSSSVLNLTELVALRPDLSHIKKIVYFHENQLVYPTRNHKDRDFQYGYNQILTCLVADVVLFNSKYNQDSFLDSINKFLKLQPDFRPKELKQQIVPKCRVLYFPIEFPTLHASEQSDDGRLHIVWPHRWEHDKDPNTFFRALLALVDAGLDFCVSVLGESFSEIPPVFVEARTQLGNRVANWGHQKTKDDYYKVLRHSHIVVSTAKHEFYGVAMLEATYCGCFPLCPNALVYPELYPSECLYTNEKQLIQMLKTFCVNPALARHMRDNLQMDFKAFSAEHLINEYRRVLS
ncbi:tRNA-queuosine alpha-mannosyltransferase [Periplaneta americana]|uniref:tRNA-queuosine alpha-mannosyltransferase n=1 Tax=Periplaneta americana TaxID=6978 RepID=UPI0037E99BCC